MSGCLLRLTSVCSPSGYGCVPSPRRVGRWLTIANRPSREVQSAPGGQRSCGQHQLPDRGVFVAVGASVAPVKGLTSVASLDAGHRFSAHVTRARPRSTDLSSHRVFLASSDAPRPPHLGVLAGSRSASGCDPAKRRHRGRGTIVADLFSIEELVWEYLVLRCFTLRMPFRFQVNVSGYTAEDT